MQSECPLHKGRLTGGLFYAPNTMGNYSMYAPSCNGCEYGTEERLMFGRIARVASAIYNAQENKTPDSIKEAWDAIKACLKGKLEETQQIPYYVLSLQKLDPRDEVVDLILAGEFDKAFNRL